MLVTGFSGGLKGPVQVAPDEDVRIVTLDAEHHFDTVLVNASASRVVPLRLLITHICS